MMQRLRDLVEALGGPESVVFMAMAAVLVIGAFVTWLARWLA